MKKRVLSMFMALTLCLTLLSAPVRAAENGIAVQDGGDSAVENGVAEVAIDGKTTQYTDIVAAFATAQGAESTTVKLLKNVTIPTNADGYSYGINLKSGNITLDLNGRTIQTTGRPSGFVPLNAVFYIGDGSSLTVQDSGTGGKIVQPNGGQAIGVSGGTLTVKSGIIEVTSDSADADSITTQNCAVFVRGSGVADIQGGTLIGNRGIYIGGKWGGGTLTVSGGTIHGKSSYALEVVGGSAALSGGTYTTDVENGCSIWNAGGAAALLDSGYRFESEGSESKYSNDTHGVVGNTTVAERPANEFAYMGADGTVQTKANCTLLTTAGFEGALADNETWFTAKEDVTADGPLQVLGTVNLILCDGVTVTLNKGICLSGSEDQMGTLNIYAQSGGTGKLICGGASDSTNAGIYISTGMTCKTALNIYGGNITATGSLQTGMSADSCGAGIGTSANDENESTMTVNISGGTVTTRSGGAGAAAIGNGTNASGMVTVTIAPGMKCVKTDDQSTACGYGNTDGTSVTVTKCNDHVWKYNVEDEAHTKTCKLCNEYGGSEAHKAEKYVSVSESQHSIFCICGKEIKTEDHSREYLPNPDGLTHKTSCKCCGWTSPDEKHTFGDNGDCSVCHIRKSAEYGEQEYASLQAAVNAAAKAADGGTVKLARDVEENVNVTGGTLTVDLSGKKWLADIRKNPDIWGRIPLTVTGGSVTLENGTLDQGRTTSAGSYGVRIQGGSVTVEGDAVVTGSNTTGSETNISYPAIRLEDGVLTLKTGAALVHGLEVPEGKHLSDYLPEGTAFRLRSYDEAAGTLTEDNGLLTNAYTTNVYNVPNMALVVVEHTQHNFVQNEDGEYVCACGYTCTHGGKNGFDQNATACPDCNTPAVAETDLNGGEGGRQRRRFADLQTAIDADRDGGATLQLLADVTGDYTINGTQDTGLYLNGHCIKGTVTVKAAAGNNTTTFSNTRNTTTAGIDAVVAYKGANLAGSDYPAVIGELTLADTTQWKDILQQTTHIGFRVTNTDGTHTWYAPDDVKDSQLSNVIINYDNAAPDWSGNESGIRIKSTWWNKLLSSVTFGRYKGGSLDVYAKANDSQSGVAEYYYYIDNSYSTTTLTAEELDTKTFTKVAADKNGITKLTEITSDNNYVIYAYAVDAAGNRSTYISSDGVVLDNTAPVISDVKQPAKKAETLTDTTATITFTGSEEGNCYYILHESINGADADAPKGMSNFATKDIADADAQVDTWTANNNGVVTQIMTAGSNKIELTRLKANTSYVLYLAATDAAGNASVADTVAAEGEGSGIVSVAFTTTKTIPYVEKAPVLSGTYGDKFSELMWSIDNVVVASQGSTKQVLGTWSIASEDADKIPTVSTSEKYTLKFTPTEEDADTYDTVTCEVTPEISKKPIIVMIANKEKFYGDEIPKLTWKSNPLSLGGETYNTLVNGDTEEALGIRLSTTAEHSSNVGTYAITGLSNSDNYEVSFTGSGLDGKSGVLTVKQAANSFTTALSCSDYTYAKDKTPEPKAAAKYGTVTYKYATVDSTDTADTAPSDESAYTDTVPVNAGSYAVKAYVAETENYTGLTSDPVVFTIAKLAKVPNMPETAMAPAHSTEKVGDIALPDGWSWSDADKDKVLADGVAVIATAVYTGADEVNYEIKSVTVTITRSACTHANTELRNAKKATCTQDGYSGDTYCAICDTKLASGEAIKAAGHKLAKVEAEKPTVKEAGNRAYYKCDICGGYFEDSEGKVEITDKNSVVILAEPAKKGTILTETKSGTTYKVTGSDPKKPEMEYKAPKNKKETKVVIPDTVTIDGVEYAVTSIAKNAFKNNKKLTKVKIGRNVKSIGESAFSGCKKLSKVELDVNLTKIGKNAFRNCKRLKTITIKSTKLNKKNVGKGAFKGISSKAVFKVPKSKLAAYRKLFRSKGLSKKARFKKY